VANLINVFEPEAIAFGGSFAYYDDIFMPRLKKQIEKHLFNKETKYKLLVSQLKNDAGIVGAAEL
jgi:predicted NBD/HSP70 family sugar kinase